MFRKGKWIEKSLDRAYFKTEQGNQPKPGFPLLAPRFRGDKFCGNDVEGMDGLSPPRTSTRLIFENDLRFGEIFMPADKDMQILIVDDASTARRLLKNILNQLGFKNIIEADDGTTAMVKLASEKIDLVVTDWNMPKMTGIELLKNIRADPNLKSIPVLMIIVEAIQGNIIAAVKAGVSDYVVYPFNAETLEKKIERIFH